MIKFELWLGQTFFRVLSSFYLGSPQNNSVNLMMAYVSAHLPRRLDSFPNAEVADDPHDQKTQSQFPADGAQTVQVIRKTQNFSPKNIT